MTPELFERATAKGMRLKPDVFLDGAGWGQIISRGTFHGILIRCVSTSGFNAEKHFGFCGSRFSIGEEIDRYTGPELKEELHRRLVLGEPPHPGSYGENPDDRPGQGE